MKKKHYYDKHIETANHTNWQYIDHEALSRGALNFFITYVYIFKSKIQNYKTSSQMLICIYIGTIEML